MENIDNAVPVITVLRNNMKNYINNSQDDSDSKNRNVNKLEDMPFPRKYFPRWMTQTHLSYDPALKKYNKEVPQYDGGDWTKATTINKTYIQDLEQYQVDAK